MQNLILTTILSGRWGQGNPPYSKIKGCLSRVTFSNRRVTKYLSSQVFWVVIQHSGLVSVPCRLNLPITSKLVPLLNYSFLQIFSPNTLPNLLFEWQRPFRLSLFLPQRNLADAGCIRETSGDIRNTPVQLSTNKPSPCKHFPLFVWYQLRWPRNNTSSHTAAGGGRGGMNMNQISIMTQDRCKRLKSSQGQKTCN